MADQVSVRDASRPLLDWDAIDRLLGEECDGPHGNRTEVYRFDRPDAGSLWLCQRCYVPAWRAAGGPPQRTRGESRKAYLARLAASPSSTEETTNG